MEAQNDILQMMQRNLREVFRKADLNFNHIQEIRLRSEKPLAVRYMNRNYFVTENGQLTLDYSCGMIISADSINETLGYMLRYSRYAFEEEIRQGYITLSGGHRVGIGGKTVAENGAVKSINKISSLNIRISHEVIGCADRVVPYIYNNNAVKNILIIAPPCCGKTTLLRDMVRQVSDGNDYGEGMNVAVIDERSEIASCYEGIPQNNIGVRTDVLDDCPKDHGMMMAVRSLSPSVIAVDEIGGENDAKALHYVINSGCSVFATAHGYSLEDVKNKPVLSGLISEGSFDRFIILKNGNFPGRIMAITDKSGRQLIKTGG